MPLEIGPINVSDPILLAPMSGVTDLPFRRLVASFGVGLLYTEMVATKIISKQQSKLAGLDASNSNGPPTIVQLLGRDPLVMSECGLLCQDLGASAIDINLGCPARKVVGGLAGSALMKEEPLVAQIISSLVKAVQIPVTVKMRTGWDENNRNAPRLSKIAEDCGAQMITVHGRTRSQFYTGKSDWRFIGEVVNAVSVPVIGNGDIATVIDARHMQLMSGCKGVMIGRGCQGRPWFPGQVSHYIKTGSQLPDPPQGVKLQKILSHLEEMLTFYGFERGLRMAKKHLAWYAQHLLLSRESRRSLLSASNLQIIQSLLESTVSETQRLACLEEG
tara:strand:+ start:5194 stop:6189 length:996 start_codon:yes stop_codon:yes gene_type:complete